MISWWRGLTTPAAIAILLVEVLRMVLRLSFVLEGCSSRDGSAFLFVVLAAAATVVVVLVLATVAAVFDCCSWCGVGGHAGDVPSLW